MSYWNEYVDFQCIFLFTRVAIRIEMSVFYKQTIWIVQIHINDDFLSFFPFSTNSTVRMYEINVFSYYILHYVLPLLCLRFLWLLSSLSSWNLLRNSPQEFCLKLSIIPRSANYSTGDAFQCSQWHVLARYVQNY